MHSFHSFDCLLSIFFDDYMSKLFPTFYLANFVCFYPLSMFLSFMFLSIIKHARKSVLFNDGKHWTKKDSNSLFDVTMSSYDGAEICELVGLFILNKLGQKFGKENIGLYRDDGWQS